MEGRELVISLFYPSERAIIGSQDVSVFVLLVNPIPFLIPELCGQEMVKSNPYNRVTERYVISMAGRALKTDNKEQDVLLCLIILDLSEESRENLSPVMLSTPVNMNLHVPTVAYHKPTILQRERGSLSVRNRRGWLLWNVAWEVLWGGGTGRKPEVEWGTHLMGMI